MQTFVIKDGIVQNVIEISGMSRMEYEQLEQCKLVDVEGYIGVTIGDTYDEQTGLFYRDGVRLDVLNALTIRNNRLKASDFAVMPDYPCGEAERAGWLAYRQALRDIPEQAGYPDAIVWPEPPEREKAAKTLLKDVALSQAQIQAVSDRGEFVEDCLAEMATVVYS